MSDHFMNLSLYNGPTPPEGWDDKGNNWTPEFRQYLHKEAVKAIHAARQGRSFEEQFTLLKVKGYSIGYCGGCDCTYIVCPICNNASCTGAGCHHCCNENGQFITFDNTPLGSLKKKEFDRLVENKVIY